MVVVVEDAEAAEVEDASVLGAFRVSVDGEDALCLGRFRRWEEDL